MGDGCWAAFSSAPDAAAAAIEFQAGMQRSTDGPDGRLRVRIGLHTGEVEPTEGDYFGPVPNRSARVAGLANGDQIVCSASTAALLDDHRELRSEGLHDLKGIGSAEIFVLFAEGIHTDVRPLRRPVAPLDLPHVHSTFVGRDGDVADIVAHLGADHAVVTLSGPGGVGKTRLAVEIGTEMAETMTGTIQFCDLTTAGDDDDVAPTVAALVGARHQPGMDLVGSIVDYLAARPGVLILDNCEHVLPATRTLVQRLTVADRLQVLATSREALGVDGEQIITVDPLPLGSAAVELFVDRARLRDPAFELTPTNERRRAGHRPRPRRHPAGHRARRGADPGHEPGRDRRTSRRPVRPPRRPQRAGASRDAARRGVVVLQVAVPGRGRALHPPVGLLRRLHDVGHRIGVRH